MPRQPKPYLHQQTKSWYCSFGGHQISLGKDSDAAFEQFYELLGDREEVKSEMNSLYDESQVYLGWCQAHRKPGTNTGYGFPIRNASCSTSSRRKKTVVFNRTTVLWKLIAQARIVLAETPRNPAASFTTRNSSVVINPNLAM
ncbi:hypothetical protein [Aeoliella sp.]|uniref:hypothetical protein n=1 Tax=Aeoliella sp. TaxID=2795800 RepID=UPI003CCBCE65